MSSIQKRPDGRWRARYRDAADREHARHFPTKKAAQGWLDSVTATVVVGTYVDPKTAKTTMATWCETWLKGYAVHRESSVRQARTHVKRIVKEFGSQPLGSIRASEVRTWIAKLQAEGLADSTIYALHARLAHIMSDAVHDGLISKSPLSRRTSPRMAKQRPYVATTEQIWALHDALPEHFRPVVLLGAFAGLRVAEIAVLRTSDVDFMRGIITPAIQYAAHASGQATGSVLKTEMSRTPIPIPNELALELARVPKAWGSDTLVVGAFGRPVAPYTIEEAFRRAREQVAGLPVGFRIHDCRHYFASLLIASGMDIKTVQARLRHASAKTTLDTYGHMWPDRDESSRAAVAGAFATRDGIPADFLRTDKPAEA